ncbi:uncharacterized protein LOC113284097 isoform X2 [Papaver somniferum]|uniref:uncharacterized protein LOC113284097 isoform X2 n=1 Tax=Papaver somniferum TaxID=3469 RepID=UPI000E701460|nr:uncharacterized protein LOC113284097 isoform X2 [Papaver somniferum]
MELKALAVEVLRGRAWVEEEALVYQIVEVVQGTTVVVVVLNVVVVEIKAVVVVPAVAEVAVVERLNQLLSLLASLMLN